MEAALADHTRSLAIREAINHWPGIAASLTALADLALRCGCTRAALDLANRASRLAGETGNRESFWQGRTLAGRSHLALGAFEAAHEAFADAIEMIEDLRVDVGGERGRRRYFERKLEPYHRLVALLLEQSRPADALRVAERARARVLFDVLQQGPTGRRLFTADERAHERAIELPPLDAAIEAVGCEVVAAAHRRRGAARGGFLRATRRAHQEFRAALDRRAPRNATATR